MRVMIKYYFYLHYFLYYVAREKEKTQCIPHKVITQVHMRRLCGCSVIFKDEKYTREFLDIKRLKPKSIFPAYALISPPHSFNQNWKKDESTKFIMEL